MTMEAYDATLRLGTRLSVCAAAVAMLLSMLGDVSEPSFVFSVLLIGSLASWILGHLALLLNGGLAIFLLAAVTDILDGNIDIPDSL